MSYTDNFRTFFIIFFYKIRCLYNKLKPYNYLTTEMFTHHLDIQVDIYN